MKSSWLLRMLAAALLAAATLVTAACTVDEQNYNISGTIDSTTYTKSGYLLPTAVGSLTQLIAADSMDEYLAGTDDYWYITFNGTTTGTYTGLDSSVTFHLGNGETYFGGDVTISVTTYSSTEVAGTFSGTLNYSEDINNHPVQGEFCLPW